MKKFNKKYWVMPRNGQYVQETSGSDMDAMMNPFASLEEARQVAKEMATKGVHPDGRIPFGYVVVTNCVTDWISDDFIQWNHQIYHVVAGYVCDSSIQPEAQAQVIGFNTYYNTVTEEMEKIPFNVEWNFTDELSAMKWLKKEWNNFYSSEIGMEIFGQKIFAEDFRVSEKPWKIEGIEKSFKSKGDPIIFFMENYLLKKTITEK